MTPLEILFLYLCFRFKQLSCDYLLNNSWMALNRGKKGLEGYIPLAAHASIHALGTLCVFLLFQPSLWWFMIVDFIIHGTIDRIKAVLTDAKGWTEKDKSFWIALGIDQEAHNITHLTYLIIILISLGGISL